MRFEDRFTEALKVSFWLLCFLPTVALGQVLNVQVNEYSVSNSKVEVLEEVQQEFGSFRIVSADEIEETGRGLPPTWDMGGVDLFRLPEASADDSDIFVSDALIGPVWTHNLEQGSTALGKEKGGGQKSLSQNSVTILEGNSKEISLSVSCPVDMTVTISGYDGTDLSVSPAQLTYTSQNCVEKTEVMLTADQDGDATHDDPIQLVLERSAGGSTGRETLTVTIYDDEIPLTFPPRFVQEGSPISLPVPLYPPLAPPSEDVIFTISGHEGTDLVPTQQELTFKVNKWQGLQILNLSTKLDDDDEDDKVTLTFTASGGGYSGLKYEADITIADRRPFSEYVPEGESIQSKSYFIFVGSIHRAFVAITITYSGFQGTDLILGQTIHMVKSNQWQQCSVPGDGVGYCTRKVPTKITADHDDDEVDDEVDLVITGTYGPPDDPIFSIKAGVAVTIGDDDDPGIEIDPPELSINEGETGTFKVKLSDAPLGDFGNNDVTVRIPSRDGDLTADPNILKFTNDDWDKYKTVVLTTYHDVDLVDDLRALILEASGGGYDLERARLSVKIIEDDEGALKVVPDTVFVDEGSAKRFLVGLKYQPTDIVNVTISDFTPEALKLNHGPLKFGPLDYNIQYRVGIDAKNYQVTDDETHTLTLTATGGGYDTQSDVTVIVKNKPDPSVKRLIVEPDSITVARGDDATFKVSLSEVPDAFQLVTVTIPLFNNLDLTRTPDSLIFNLLDFNIPKIVTISADDNATDGPETLTLTAKGGGYDNITADVLVTVENTDLVGASLVVDPESIFVDEDGEKTFDVSLSVQPTDSVMVAVPAFDNSDLTRMPETLTFTTSNYDMTQPITISATQDDNAINESETLTLTASGGGYDDVTETVTVNIDDDDEAKLNISPSPLTVNEGSSATLDVSLSAEPTGDVTVAILEFTNSDLKPIPETLTFTASNYDMTQPVTISAMHDDDSDDDSASLTLEASGSDYEGVMATVDVTITDDDPPGLIVKPTSLDIREEGQPEFFDVKLRTQPSRNVEVSLSTLEAEAELINFDKSILTFTNSSWSKNQQVNVTALTDEDSNNETIIITLKAINYGENVTESVIVNVTDDDITTSLPQINLSASPSIAEGDFLEIRVMASETLTQEVDIPLKIFDQSTDSNDYGTLSIVKIPSGEQEESTTLSIINDEVYEGNEFFILRFGDLPDEVRSGTSSSQRVEIVDASEPPMVTLDVSPGSVFEEGKDITVIANLSDALPTPITVPLIIIPGGTARELDDYEVETPFEVLFPAKSRQGTAVRVAAKIDQKVEKMETFQIGVETLSRPLVPEYPTPIEITIEDGTEPEIDAPPDLNVTEGINKEFHVKLTAEPYDLVTMRISGGIENLLIEPRTRTLTFTPQDWDDPKPVDLLARDDQAISRYETFVITLIATGGGYDNITHHMTVMITDRSSPNLVVKPRTLPLEETETKSFDVSLSTKPSGPVTLSVTPAHGQTYLEAPLPSSPLIFDESNYGDPQPVMVTAKKDNDSNNESETITIRASGGDYSSAPPITVDVTITDIDPEIYIDDGEALEDEKTIHLPLRLSRSTNQVVTVQYATKDGSAETEDDDYISSEGIVIFDPGATQGVIQLEINDDQKIEGDETFLVTLSNARYANLSDDPEGTATILNDDEIVGITIEDAVAGNHSSMISFSVRLSHPIHEAISVSYRTENESATAGEDYSPATGYLTFEPGTTQETIDITLLQQDVDWQQKTFFVHVESMDTARMEKSIATAVIGEQIPTATDVMTSYTARFIRTASIHLTDALQQRLHPAGSSCSAMQRAEMSQLWHTTSRWTPSLGELLSGCRVSKDVTMSEGSFGIWGRGAFRRFHGQNDNTLTLRGNVSTAILGADYRWHAGWMAGMMVAHSQSSGDFQVTHGSGDTEAGLTGIYPYVSYEASGWEVWMSGGYGWGHVEIPNWSDDLTQLIFRIERGKNQQHVEISDRSEDLTSRFGAVGFKGNLALVQTSQWSYYGDVLVTDATVSGTRAEVIRVRLGMETDFQISDVIHPYLDANVRQDGGNAETGIGLEIGGGLRITHPDWKLRGEVRSQGLVLHSADGFSEWGLSGSIQYGNPSEGLSMRIRPSWGINHGMAFYHQQTIRDATAFQSGLSRTEVEVGYGVPTKHGTLRSIAAITELPTGRLLRLGGELRPLDWVSIAVSGVTHHHRHGFGDISFFVQSTFWN